MKPISDCSILCRHLKSKYLNNPKHILVVLVGGLSQSGKSTLSEKMCNYLEDNKIENRYICLDNWIVDISERTGRETVRERFLYDDIFLSVTDILNGNDITIYVYNPASRGKSESLLSINSLEFGVLIIDGVVSLDIKELRHLSKFRVYVSTNHEERLKRLIDFHVNYKNLSLKETSSIIKSRAIDETPIIEKTKKFANYLFVN